MKIGWDHEAGHPLRPDAFRKQLSRARRVFAEFLVADVAQTLERPTPDRVEEELAEVGLLATVRDFLPPDWKARLVWAERTAIPFDCHPK